MEGWEMLKKSLLALFGLVFAIALITPPKAKAERRGHPKEAPKGEPAETPESPEKDSS
jgi:hypothetical protein